MEANMNLREYRQRANLTQKELGGLVIQRLSRPIQVGHFQKVISEWEGKGKIPPKDIQTAVCEILGITDLDDCLIPTYPNGKKAWHLCLLESVRSEVMQYVILIGELPVSIEESGKISDHIYDLLSILTRSFLSPGITLDAKHRLLKIVEEFSPKLPKKDHVWSLLQKAIRSLDGISYNPNNSFP